MNHSQAMAAVVAAAIAAADDMLAAIGEDEPPDNVRFKAHAALILLDTVATPLSAALGAGPERRAHIEALRERLQALFDSAD